MQGSSRAVLLEMWQCLIDRIRYLLTTSVCVAHSVTEPLLRKFSAFTSSVKTMPHRRNPFSQYILEVKHFHPCGSLRLIASNSSSFDGFIYMIAFV